MWRLAQTSRTLDSNRVIAFNERNEPAFLIALFEDVTDRKSLSKELENAKKFLETVLDNIPVSLMVQQISTGRYLFANRGAEVILGRKREDAIGLTVPEMLRPEEAKLIVSRDQAAIRGRTPIAEEHPISTRDGLRLFLTRRVTVLDEAGEPQYLIKTHEDVTDRRQTEARMAHMAYHDGLTDLPNRPAFLQALSQMIDACGETSEEFAVLSIDLDGLKEVNDVFGHAIGDKLLIEVSRRVDAAVGGGVVARLGGDEFGVIIDGAQPAAGLLIAERISAALAEEFPIEGKSVRTGVTTGISLFPRDGHDLGRVAGEFRRGAVPCQVAVARFDQHLRAANGPATARSPRAASGPLGRDPQWRIVAALPAPGTRRPDRRRCRRYGLRGTARGGFIRRAVSCRPETSFRWPKKVA